MTRLENRILELIKKHYAVLFVVAITVVGLVMRYAGLNYKSGDWHVFFEPWYQIIMANGQIECLQYPVGDYNVLYQTLFTLLTYIPKDPLYLLKAMAFCFDFSLALGCAACVSKLVEERKKESAILTYSLIWISPFVVMNSAYWVQTEAICTSFIIWALYFLLQEKNIPAFVCLGVAFAFKIQVLFVLPFLIFIYVLNKSFSLLHLLIPIVVGWMSSVPAILCGRGVFSFFEVYMGQKGELTQMSVNYPNFWMVMGGSYAFVETFAIFLTTAIFGIGMFLLLSHNVAVDSGKKALPLLIWTVWTVVMFMPGMHDRYGYLLETVLLVSLVIDLKKYLPYALGVYLATFISYSNYLFGSEYDVILWAFLHLITYVLFTIRYFTVEIRE